MSASSTYNPLSTNNSSSTGASRLSSFEIEHADAGDDDEDDDGDGLVRTAAVSDSTKATFVPSSSRPKPWSALVFVTHLLTGLLYIIRRYPLILLALLGLINACLVAFLILAGPCIMNQTYYYHTPLSTASAVLSPINVILLGDSLVMGSHFPMFHIVASRVQQLLPHFDIKMHNLGEGGNGITAIKSRLPSVYAPPADAVILLWDSDAYALGDNETPNRLDWLRSVYISNVTYVVQQIQQHHPGVKVALAGPIIVGDGPWSFRHTVEEYKTKGEQFDEYRDINRHVATSVNATYIDLRKAYLDSIPSYHRGFRHCVTVDGNHPSTNGAYINAYHISKTLLDWFQSTS